MLRLKGDIHMKKSIHLSLSLSLDIVSLFSGDVSGATTVTALRGNWKNVTPIENATIAIVLYSISLA